MSEDLLFEKIAEPEMTPINFHKHFCDRMGDEERGHIEVYPNLWNLRPYNKTNGDTTRIPRLLAAYQRVRKELKIWDDFERLHEETPEFSLIRRLLLGGDSLV